MTVEHKRMLREKVEAAFESGRDIAMDNRDTMSGVIINIENYPDYVFEWDLFYYTIVYSELIRVILNND